MGTALFGAQFSFIPFSRGENFVFSKSLTYEPIMIIALVFLAFIIGVLIIITLFGRTLPRIATIERSVIINAPYQTVFPEVSNLRNFVTWDPWTRKDPNIQQTFSGEDGTVGSSFSWKGNNKVRQGTMTITGIEPGSLVTLDIDFGNRGTAKCSFVVEDLNEQTKVTWGFESDMGSAFRRGIFTKMMKSFIEKDYDAGLNNLKTRVEANS